MAAMSVPSDYVAKAVAEAVKAQIEAEVEQALMDVVVPKVKEIAASTAKQMMERAAVHISRDMADMGHRLMVSFNGEIYGEGKQ
ncbi:hypothetical protein K6V92_10335 [Cupriavidus respiraculi]|uniref:hypothetical protein n=1 Tax=Cupriavidus respiraculi TaxID=195930 RepID=UPI001C951916|nr:hypothetical protein [Cupriavidus respiraculi]MBY4947015.1 hypothetical protein [Cupriavidus respiraculi]